MCWVKLCKCLHLIDRKQNIFWDLHVVAVSWWFSWTLQTHKSRTRIGFQQVRIITSPWCVSGMWVLQLNLYQIRDGGPGVMTDHYTTLSLIYRPSIWWDINKTLVLWSKHLGYHNCFIMILRWYGENRVPQLGHCFSEPTIILWVLFHKWGGRVWGLGEEQFVEHSFLHCILGWL